MRILLVEDEVELARWVARALEQGGFVIEHVADGLQAEARLMAEEYDAVVLDLRLPGKDGLAVLKAMRGRDDRTPVLILTAQDTLDERVRGLNLGADDYLPKPFAIAELEARILALIRRSRGRAHPRLQCGTLVFDGETRSFTLGGAPLALTPRESTLLGALLGPQRPAADQGATARQGLLARCRRESGRHRGAGLPPAQEADRPWRDHRHAARLRLPAGTRGRGLT